MALDAETFADLFLTYFQEEMTSTSPDTVKSRQVTEETRSDGSIVRTVTEQIGPPEVDTEKLRPMAVAMGRAVVELVVGHAEVVDTVAGQSWRVT